MTSQTQLNGNEVILITFSDQFLSTNGVNLYNKQAKGNLNKVPVYPDIIAIAGASTNVMMATTVSSIVTINILLSGSCELLWGFLNTMQIIYFFPLMSHYLPDLYMQFLFRLTSSKMDFDFFDFKQYYAVDNTFSLDPGKPLFNFLTRLINLEMPSLNDNYEELGYDSTSVLVNLSALMMTICNGIAT